MPTIASGKHSEGWMLRDKNLIIANAKPNSDAGLIKKWKSRNANKPPNMVHISKKKSKKTVSGLKKSSVPMKNSIEWGQPSMVLPEM
jgi:hypothetical protein